MHRFVALITGALALLASLMATAPDCEGGVNPWKATGFGVGLQGAWFDQETPTELSDVEAKAQGVVSLMPHVSLVGTGAYGFQHSYLRGAAGVRVTLSNPEDRIFSVAIGASRHFRDGEGGMDDWAGEGALGWHPIADSPLILTITAAREFSENAETQITAGFVYALKLVQGAQ